MIARSRIVSAGAFLSGIVGLDLLLNLFCSGFPLLIYCVVGGAGVWFGGRYHERLLAAEGAARFLRRLGVLLAAFSVFGIIVQFVQPVNWATKCSWRYCGRAMAPGLFKSPFPVGTPSCSAWDKCANEYPFTPAGYDSLLQRMERQDCEAP